MLLALTVGLVVGQVVVWIMIQACKLGGRYVQTSWTTHLQGRGGRFRHAVRLWLTYDF